jgi:hypothetical protein
MLALSRDFLALLSRFGKPNGDGLLAAFDFSAAAAFSGLGAAALIAVHFAFNVGAGTPRIFSFSLGHPKPPKYRFKRKYFSGPMPLLNASRGGSVRSKSFG